MKWKEVIEWNDWVERKWKGMREREKNSGMTVWKRRKIKKRFKWKRLKV